MSGGEDPKGRRVQRELGEDSERLLKAIEELRDLEERKRREPIASKPFRDLAQQVEAKAREVYKLADEEVDDARDARNVAPPGASIADDEPEGPKDSG
jgi:hypothetical protein